MTISLFRRVLSPAPSGTRGAILSRRLACHHRSNVNMRSFQDGASQSYGPFGGIEDLYPMVPEYNSMASQNIPELDAFLKTLPTRQLNIIWPAFAELQKLQLDHHLTSAHLSSLLGALRPREAISIKQRTEPDRFDPDEVYISSIKNASIELWKKVDIVIAKMYQHNDPLLLTDYTHLLEICRSTKKHNRAESVWREMADKKLKPSTWAYNVYLAVGTGTASTPAPLVDNDVIAARLRGGKQSESAVSKINVKNVVTRSTDIYTEMVNKQIYPNAMTVEMIILGYSRVGYISRMVEFIDKVWGIKIKANEKDGAEPSTAIVSSDSPLYPSENTILVLASAFCQNGEMQMAVEYVQRFSTLYKLDVSEATWAMLLQWSYTLSGPRYAQLPRRAPHNLWDMMMKTPAGKELATAASALDIVIRTEIRRLRSNDSAEREYVRDKINRTMGFIDSAIMLSQNLKTQNLAAAENPILVNKMLSIGTVSSQDRQTSMLSAWDVQRRLRMWDGRITEWVEELLLVVANATQVSVDSKDGLPKQSTERHPQTHISQLTSKYNEYLKPYSRNAPSTTSNITAISNQWHMLGTRIPSSIFIRVRDKNYVMERYRASTHARRRRQTGIPFVQSSSKELQNAATPSRLDVQAIKSSTTASRSINVDSIVRPSTLQHYGRIPYDREAKPIARPLPEGVLSQSFRPTGTLSARPLLAQNPPTL